MSKVQAHNRPHHSHQALRIKGKSIVTKGPVAHASGLILRAQEWTSQEAAKSILEKYGDTKLERMLLACENISKLSGDIGLTKNELFDIARYIETEQPSKTAYLRKEDTGLARTIEQVANRTFIHLKTHNVAPLGKGFHKSVTRSIMYDVEHPALVANSVGDATLQNEIEILKSLQGAEGVVQTYAVGKHKKKSGKEVYSVIMKLYNTQTIRSTEFNLQKLTPDEEVYVARDLMKGLESLHAKKIAHRDLHTSNFVLHREHEPHTGKLKISCAIADFGEASSFEKAKKATPLVEYSGRFVTPESLIKGKHRVDVRKVEAFAVGCGLYHLFFGREPSWCEKMEHKHVHKLSTKKKKSLSKTIASEIRQTLDRRKNDLASMTEKHRGLGEVILSLLDPDPKKRFSPQKAREMLDGLVLHMQAAA